jgi:hypothetical protein
MIERPLLIQDLRLPAAEQDRALAIEAAADPLLTLYLSDVVRLAQRRRSQGRAAQRGEAQS